MDINNFIENVNKIDWSVFDGTIYYKPENVPKTLIALASSVYEEPIKIETMSVYNTLAPKVCTDVLFAIGNDHSGTYYSVIKEALHFIIQVALYGNNKFSRNYAIQILYDLYYFSPDNGDLHLRDFVKTSIAKEIENFIKLACIDQYNETLIKEFVNSIREDTAQTEY